MTEQTGEQPYDEAVERVHRAFCDPDHELIGEWDREMAEALRRNGYRIEREATEGAASPSLRAAWTGPDGETPTDIIRRYAEQVAWPHGGYDPVREWADRLDAALAATPSEPER